MEDNNGSQHEEREQAVLLQPKTYFQLIQKVGCQGPYQRNVFLIFFLNWFIASLLIMGTSFLFLNPKIDCAAQGVTTENCEQYVCSLSENQREKFYKKQAVNSLATEFGPFHCDDALKLDALRMVLYIGTFFGYIGVLFITDNYGRKFSIVLAWGLTLAGIVILSASVNIQMACVGLFLAGFGCQSSIRISMIVFGEIVDYVIRQKYSVALQISFGLGEITIGLMYFLIYDWRLVTILFCLIPGIIQMILLAFYFEETPKYGIKKDKVKGMNSLNRIGKINQKKENIITEQDIDRVLQNQVKSTKVRSPLDLCIFKSQRVNFIASSVIFFCITYIYFGPVIIVSNLGLNIFVSQIVLGVSETIAYPISYLFIERSPRKLTGYVFFGLTSIFFAILIFVVPNKQCDGCSTGIIQLILVFAARFCTCYYFSVFFLFVTQIFPLPLRGIGFGMGSAIAAVASSSGQFVISFFESIGFNSFIVFTICALICTGTTYFLPETYKQPMSESIPEEVEEENKEKNEIKSQGHVSEREKSVQLEMEDFSKDKKEQEN